MDTLYIGDIPLSYHYAIFNNNYIDLYETDSPNGNSDYYRLYLYNNLFFYDHRINNQYFTNSAIDINVTDNYIYRRDFPSILNIVFIFSIFFIIIFNVFTSFFKKGGLFNDVL